MTPLTVTSPTSVAILMATYNGGKYLAEQVGSIVAQTCDDWHLYIHDDGSTDNTAAILADFHAKYPEKITVLAYPPQGDPCKNFFSMLRRVEANYYMFSDQDDFWHADKVERSVRVIKETEAAHPGAPIVIHSDLRVVDESLREIHPSFFAYSGIRPERNVRFRDYACQNAATGCTMIFNQAAKEAAFGRDTSAAVMHDAWVTLRAIADGGIRHCINQPLTDYRQHAANVLGAQGVSRLTPLYRIRHFRQMAKKNRAHFKMMQAAGRMTLSEYLFVKIRHFLSK